MDFATLSPTMSRSPDNLMIPKPRQPLHDRFSQDKNEKENRHPLLAYLEQDRRWSSLSESLQLNVLVIAMDVHMMTKKQIDAKVKKLDSEIPSSPYLRSLSEKRGTLQEQHDEMVEISTLILEDVDIPPEGSHLIPYLFTQIHLAERVLGRRIEKDREIAWTTDKGFVDPRADVAIELCMAAVRDIHSPNIY